MAEEEEGRMEVWVGECGPDAEVRRPCPATVIIAFGTGTGTVTFGMTPIKG